MKKWYRGEMTVIEREVEELSEFDVIKDGEVIFTLVPEDVDHYCFIIDDLNNGFPIDGWFTYEG